MKRLLIYFVLLTFAACSFKNSKTTGPEVTFYSERSGMQTTLHMIFDLNKTGELYEKPTEIVRLKTPGKSINPYTAFSSDGDFYVMTDDKNMIEYGNYTNKNIDFEKIQRTVPFFSRKGPKEKAFGATKGYIFSIDSTSKSNRIGECKYMKIKTPEGENRTVYVSRLTEKNTGWQVLMGDRIFQLDDKGMLKQVGWLDWRAFTTEEGEKLVVLMTKGMKTKSKWAGRFNGKLYIEM